VQPAILFVNRLVGCTFLFPDERDKKRANDLFALLIFIFSFDLHHGNLLFQHALLV
jgi:hypothetical protein